MKVPFIDYPRHYATMKTELLKLLDDVLFTRADLILRDDLKLFEKNLAGVVTTKYGIGVGNCTDGLFLSLKAAGIGPGDEVITVAHTFLATIEAIVHCGAVPILVDIREDFNMDPDLLEKVITPKTKAIMPVHLNGRCCEMDKIMSIAKKHNLKVIEDAAQSLGAKFNGKVAGSFGLASCYSFFPAKLLGAAGDAGMVCTDDKELADQLFLFRDHGRQTKNHFACYGYNSRLDNIQAAILNFKLINYFPGWVTRRREIATIYDRELSKIKAVKCPPAPDASGKYFDVFQNYVIQAERRDELAEYLRNQGVETLISWPVANHQQKALKLDHFHLPVTEKVSKHVISLPLFPELTEDEIQTVVKCIREFYKN